MATLRPSRAVLLLSALVLLTLSLAGEAEGAATFRRQPDATPGGSQPFLVLDDSRYPVVSYYDSAAGDLKLLRCDDPICTGTDSLNTPATIGDVGQFSSLALDHLGYPVVSYYDATNDTLQILRCNEIWCLPGGESITSPAGPGTGTFSSIQLDRFGIPSRRLLRRRQRRPQGHALQRLQLRRRR